MSLPEEEEEKSSLRAGHAQFEVNLSLTEQLWSKMLSRDRKYDKV